MSARPQPLIAVVDDDESVCCALRRLVRSMDMRVDTFTSSEEFLRLATATKYHPDCLVLDLQMPRLNGLAVQRRLKEGEAHIPIVFITAHDQQDARNQALRHGAVAYLRKPFNDTQLIRALQAALHGTAFTPDAPPATDDD